MGITFKLLFGALLIGVYFTSSEAQCRKSERRADNESIIQ